ncbi:MAG: EAL domain-containing response regulator [Nannocystaceae bacterium]
MRPRVLILDDDPISGLFLKAAVTSHHASAEQITDAAELAKVVRSGWDALFLDLVMPGLDGIDVLRQHAADAASFPPLVLVSGLDAGILETAVHFARQLGYRVDGALPKPVVRGDVWRLLDGLDRRRTGSHRATTEPETIERSLAAIRAGELFLRYQPQVDMVTGRPVGAEALVRWAHPGQGELLPLAFVPLLEGHGAAEELARFVVERAIADTARLRCDGPLRVSVNVHASVLRSDDFADYVIDALARHKAPAERLCIEATEAAIVDDSADTLETLVKLRMAGVHLAIDDFGTGHSTLQQVWRLPVSEIKLDRSYVSQVTTSTKSRALILGVLQMAQGLRATVVAEGVETEEIRAALLDIGCTIGQGYLFARPLAIDAFAAWLADAA